MKYIATWIENTRGKHFEEMFAGTDFKLWDARIEIASWDDVRGLFLTGGSDISDDCPNQMISDSAVATLSKSSRSGLYFIPKYRGYQTSL
jgi:hypothetical protein